MNLKLYRSKSSVAQKKASIKVIHSLSTKTIQLGAMTKNKNKKQRIDQIAQYSRF